METSEITIDHIITNQKKFFNRGKTRSIEFRINQLRRLKKAVIAYQSRIEEALWKDLHKSPEEAYLTEFSIVLGEINYHLKNLYRWSKPKKVKTPLHLWPSTSRIYYEPLGVSLIMAPWNYPFQLLINSLIGSISAGCCSLLKPSPDVPNTAKVIEEMITEYFSPEYIAIIQGGKDTNTVLFSKRFDIIFFTGSPMVGKVLMKAASTNLTPVVLELGGKSPCIVDKDANLDIAARRIAWGKLINAGQTCIAPDYLFVHESVKDELIRKMIENITAFYGKNIQQSRYFPRIVNQTAMERLIGLLSSGKIVFGGNYDIQERYFAPTIIDQVNPEDPIMKQEIFGPLLPVMAFKMIDKVIDYVNQQEKPLAFYYFGTNDKAKAILAKTTSGGACINDTIMHVANQVNINHFTKSIQHDTFLDRDYESLAKNTLSFDLVNPYEYPLKTNLPEYTEPVLNLNLPVYLYNFYNLDPLWDHHIPANRILLLEPDFFQKYPVSDAMLEFILSLGKNIDNLQVATIQFTQLKSRFPNKEFHFKEHPANSHYQGVQHQRDWLFLEIDDYFPSFSKFWKLVEKSLLKR